MTHSIDAFVDVAASYCSLIEHHDEYPIKEFIPRLREVLPLLYFRALALPKLEPSEETLLRQIAHDEWQTVFHRLQGKLGINDLYWEIYDPMMTNPGKPVAGSLADDLADIWRDLKLGLTFSADCSAAVRREIIWNWHFSFHNHWSDHLVDALRAINWLVAHHEIRNSDEGTY